MVLKFTGAWRFTPPDDGRFLNKAIPPGAVEDFFNLIAKITTQGDRQAVLEHFKGHFCASVGATHYRSSNESWAETDLRNYMQGAADNAPLFIEAFFDGCETLRKRQPAWFVPDVTLVNPILVRHNVG